MSEGLRELLPRLDRQRDRIETTLAKVNERLTKKLGEGWKLGLIAGEGHFLVSPAGRCYSVPLDELAAINKQTARYMRAALERWAV